MTRREREFAGLLIFVAGLWSTYLVRDVASTLGADSNLIAGAAAVVLLIIIALLAWRRRVRWEKRVELARSMILDSVEQLPDRERKLFEEYYSNEVSMTSLRAKYGFKSAAGVAETLQEVRGILVQEMLRSVSELRARTPEDPTLAEREALLVQVFRIDTSP